VLFAITASDPQRLQGDRLGNRRGADDHRVLDLYQVVEQVFRRDEESDPPARHSVSLGEAEERYGVVFASQGAGGEVRGAVVGEVFVRLVADVVYPAPGGNHDSSLEWGPDPVLGAELLLERLPELG
jgi:hypothetical protein